MKRGTKPVKSKTRPRLHRVSPETQAYSSMLMDELRSWPDVLERPMFGFQSFYRGEEIFAALPKTRSIVRNAMMFKIPVLTPAIRARMERDPRIDANSGERWINFELSGEEDLRAALSWLEMAYEAARANRK